MLGAAESSSALKLPSPTGVGWAGVGWGGVDEAVGAGHCLWPASLKCPSLTTSRFAVQIGPSA